MLHRVLLLLCFLLTGCAASVIPAWEAARDHALQDPGPPPSQWEPDAVLLLSEALVDDALVVLLAEQGNLRGEIAAGPITAVPDLSVRQVDLKAAKCERSLRVRAELEGVITVRSLLGEVDAPVRADLRFDAVFDVVQAGEVWSLTVAPRKLHHVEIDLAGADLAAFVQPIRTWLEEAVVRQPPLPLADLGSTDLPIRAMRVIPVRRDLRVDLLTTTHQARPLSTGTDAIEQGWRLDLSAPALLDLARRAAFEAGPISHDVVVEPTSLYIEEDVFTLGLRLWRLKGRGWWRDYEIDGRVTVEGRGISLQPTDVRDRGHSRGAAWADPLAALGEGVILKAIERAMETSLPAIHRERGAALKVVVQIEQVDGNGDVLVLHGGLTLKPAPAKKTSVERRP